MSHGQVVENVIKLQLKKPKKWNWELSTSKSSPNIAFPRIMLYDSNGNLIANANQSNCIFNQVTKSNAKSKKVPELIDIKVNDNIGRIHVSGNQSTSTPASDILVKKLNKHSDRDSNGSFVSIKNTSPKFINSQNIQDQNYSHYEKLPQRKLSLTSLSANEKSNSLTLPKINKTKFENYDLKKSKSTSDFIYRSNSAIREKRKCKRTNSSAPSRFSESILERMSAIKSRLSSPEINEYETKQLELRPKYFLRTCKAGTLVVTEESFRNQKRRRRPRPSITVSNKSKTSSNNISINEITEHLDDLTSKLNINCNINNVMDKSEKNNENCLLCFKISDGPKITNCKCSKSVNQINLKNNLSTNSNQKSRKIGKLAALRKCKTTQNLLLSSSDEEYNQKELTTKKRRPFLRGDILNSQHNKRLPHPETQNSNDCLNTCTDYPRCNAMEFVRKSHTINAHTTKCNGMVDPNLRSSLPSDIHSNNYLDTNYDNRSQIEYMIVTPNRKKSGRKNECLDYRDSFSANDYMGSGSNFCSVGSTFKSTHERPDVQFAQPRRRANGESCYDQGYGSERSPEDENTPRLPIASPSLDCQDCCDYQGDWDYSFISDEETFTVQIVRGSRGLGFSIAGGRGSNASFPGLIRIKRLFPHQAAWSTGQLQPGDIILEANGVQLTGLTNYEALDVLRTVPTQVVLLICRPKDDQYRKLSPPTEPPKPPQRSSQTNSVCSHVQYSESSAKSNSSSNSSAEFEITLVKHDGSLGFTLKKEDESLRGHFIRDLIREPAKSDGRLRAGDKILSVNDICLSTMSHEEAVVFLRQIKGPIKLRIYREDPQTPIEPVSPSIGSEISFDSFHNVEGKTQLRKEAVNLLTELAQRKQMQLPESSNASICSSPRRLKNNQNRSEFYSAQDQDLTDSQSSGNPTYLVSSKSTTVCSDSELSIDSQCQYYIQRARSSAESKHHDHGNSDNFTSNNCMPYNAYELNKLNNDALDSKIGNTIGNKDLNCCTNRNQLLANNGIEQFKSLPCELTMKNYNDQSGYQSNCENETICNECGECTSSIKPSEESANENYEIISIELNKGWNSRLGFSLQPDSFSGRSVISAIYNDSVAARNGLLRVGDIVVQVNDSPLENMSTTEVINLLRIIRGAILITVLRKTTMH